MTIPVSTVPAAIAALTTQVSTQTATDSQPILVYYGDLTTDAPNDIIQIGTTVRRQMRPREFIGSYQGQAFLETYDIQCLVSAWSGSADPVAITQRAYTLLGYLETAVRTDPSLGSSIIDAYPAGSDGGEPVWTDDPQGRLCEITATIHVETLT